MFSVSLWGHIFIDAALGTALLQGLIPFLGYWKKNIYLLTLARPLALIQSFLLANAFLLLVIAFLTNDFSLAYVAQNSHPSLPFYYRLTAVWGAHEGSFLLWIFLLDIWTVALCFFSNPWEKELRSLSLALLGLISFCFLLFLNNTSNPFKTITNAIPQDLNPLLQDPGFFIHPPMLYTGYVGFSVVFAITMAYLIRGSQDSCAQLSWATIIRPWILAAWSFLTIGITLGSWWAYHVLGWGGFWFWDPVENASLLPWLSGAALLHLVIVVEKQNRFNDWAIILAIVTFSLSILGTFLVRSGVLISVHSFANDPSRGLFLLLLLAVITGSAMAIYLFRRLFSSVSEKKAPWSWHAREGMLLTQTIFLFIAMATILLGTLYPLIIEASGLGTLSVGAPYFNHVLFPLLMLFLIVMGLAPFSQWGNTSSLFNKTSRRNLVLSLALAIILTLFFARQWSTFVMLSLSLVFWVLLSVKNMFFRHVSMTLAHTGFAIVIMSIVLSSTFSQEREIQLHTGEKVSLGPYVFHFVDVEGVQGPNFRSVRGNFSIWRNERFVTTLKPEKRIYLVRNTVMTTVDIYPAIFHDLYIALGEPLSEDNWSLRIYYKPFVRWVWLGGFCIALGGLLSLLRPLGRKNDE